MLDNDKTKADRKLDFQGISPRVQQVNAWLAGIGAREINMTWMGDHRLDFFQVNGRVFIVEWFEAARPQKEYSFEIFVPACDDNQIQATFAAAEERLGIRNEQVSRPGQDPDDPPAEAYDPQGGR
jgi:hypothetical protein